MYRYSKILIWTGFLLCHICLLGCVSKQQKADLDDSIDTATKQVVKDFFNAYAQRKDFDHFLSFYAPNAVLQDLVYGEQVETLAGLRAFYRWHSDEVQLLQSVALVVEEQVVEGNKAVTRGYFTAFRYHQQELGPWRFVIWQELDDSGLIKKQYDWINYTPKSFFVDGDNLNLSIQQ